MSAMLTREDARAAWASSGLTYDDLSLPRLEKLRQAINESLRQSRPIRGFCVRKKPVLHVRPGGMTWADIRCSAYYFTDRQAVTFESGGFVGFAGWASDENVQPILEAFLNWLREVKS